jgi:phasin family protein
MSNANKKSHAHPAAKLASPMAHKADSAENVVRMSSAAVKDFMAAGAGEAQKAQEKAYAMGRESAEKMAQSAEVVNKLMSEALAMSRENIEACIECSNMTASLARDMGNEALDASNKAFSDSVEMSKEAFACRTFNDFFELQNRAAQNAIESFFEQASKLSSMFFDYSGEALEPINERMAQASKQFNKVLNKA